MPASRNTLVLYTGGTIGMQQSAEGLMPASGFASRLRDQQDKHPELAVPEWQFRELRWLRPFGPASSKMAVTRYWSCMAPTPSPTALLP